MTGGASADDVEWGGAAWRRLVHIGVDEYLGADLSGLRVLELGAGNGHMSTLFALRGAQVTGVDRDDQSVRSARLYADRRGVGDRTKFISTDGSLRSAEDASYDVVFTKSVLVAVGDLAPVLGEIAAKLVPNGRVVFVENGRGSSLLHALRRFRHRWDYRGINYFTRRDIRLIGSMFDVDRYVYNRVPPIHLICARKRSTG